VRLGLTVAHSGPGMDLPLDRIQEPDRLGFDSVWNSEACGTDAITPLAWISARTTRIPLGTAIMQIHARTPVMTPVARGEYEVGPYYASPPGSMKVVGLTCRDERPR